MKTDLREEEVMMFKKMIAGVLAIAIILTASPMMEVKAAGLEPHEFVDIKDAWWTEAIVFAIQKGILKGDGNKRINAGEKISKAELSTMLARMFGTNQGVDASELPNLSQDRWYSSEIAKAVYMGIISKDIDNAGAGNSMKRQEAFTMIARAFKVKELNSTAAPSGLSDIDQVSDWARDDIHALINAGYINGKKKGDTVLIDPTGDITRAEIAQTIYNILGEIIDLPGYYNLPDGVDEIDGGVVVNKPGVILRNMTINGDLIIGEGAGNGDIILENVIVEGNIVARAGNLVLKTNSSARKLLEDKTSGRFNLSIGNQVKLEELIIASSGDVIGGDKVERVLVKSSAEDVNIRIVDISVEIEDGAKDIRDRDGNTLEVGTSLINPR